MGAAKELINEISGSVYSLFGPDLVTLSGWFKRKLRSDQVRIMGDRVKLNLFYSDEKKIFDLVDDAKSSGQIIDTFDKETPELEDIFITLISEREKRNDRPGFV